MERKMITMYGLYRENGTWSMVNKAYLEDFYTREISKTVEECGWATFEDWLGDMLRCDLVRNYSRR